MKTNSYAAQLAAACEKHGLFLTAYQIEGYAIYISALSQRLDTKLSPDEVLAHCNEDSGCFDSLINYFLRKEHSRKVFE